MGTQNRRRSSKKSGVFTSTLEFKLWHFEVFPYVCKEYNRTFAMFSAHTLHEWMWPHTCQCDTHVNVISITGFSQKCTMDACRHCMTLLSMFATLFPQALFTALQWYTLKSLRFSVLHCKACFSVYYTAKLAGYIIKCRGVY